MASFCFAHPIHVLDTTAPEGGTSPHMRSARRVDVDVVDPPTVDFGVVASGSTRTLRIEAPAGQTAPISVSTITVEGPFRMKAHDASGRRVAFPFVIGPLESSTGGLELDITFEPEGMGRSAHGLVRVELVQDGRIVEGRVRLVGAQVGLEPALAATMAPGAPVGPEAR